MSGLAKSRLRLIVCVLVTLDILNSLAAEAADATRPNVIFIFTDDHAAHAMSCYDSKINQT